ncbi:fumarate/nitrate reduction transcriptional regulator Fnr [Roseateles toxinivorans]|uniref:CRP/FNR family transcriptional regulator n=1 Tax=Roseateles toxinivorans TaxID=270368 RepID=A0A4R6QUC8_9BURK|nr:fumarate/nitrate reduction transcriptional regulator Fnr [Roseateles toxinivorans]TDP74432.1 CRP/FNR family transcriptional regulator [Roseateles toxinivorans]
MFNTSPAPHAARESSDAGDGPCAVQRFARVNPVVPGHVHIQAEPFKVACSSCNLRELCLPVGLNKTDLDQLDTLVETRRSVARGETLFRTGDSFQSLYAVRTGFFKTCVSSEDGRDQVTGFQMAGELLGLDGISTERHACDAVALEDSQVCVIPYEQLESLSREFGDLQRQFHKIMSREIVRDHGVMLLLGSMRAEERLAAFLLNLTQRLQARGFSASSLVLRMTREEIGSYLGLKLETVSRAFSKFQEQGLLEVKQRQIRILDQAGLQALVNSSPS